MYDRLIDKIKEYETIVIHRHIQPDLDALGSQLGMKALIESNFSDKTVHVLGENNEFSWIGTMDEVDDAVFNDALAIVLDVAGKERVSDQRFLSTKEKIVVDHHRNDSDFADIFIGDPEKIATCEMLVEMIEKHDLKVSKEAATYILSGLITDSGRFLYPQTTAYTFSASFLMRKGADLQYIYNNLYQVDYNFQRLKGYFIHNFKQTPNNVAYMKNSSHLKDEYDVTTFTVSRGMVNQMAGIKGIDIWANFTETDTGDIQCELRSKSVPIVDIAKKYGGGGHDLACGCTAQSWEDVDNIIEDLDAIAERIKQNG